MYHEDLDDRLKTISKQHYQNDKPFTFVIYVLHNDFRPKTKFENNERWCDISVKYVTKSFYLIPSKGETATTSKGETAMPSVWETLSMKCWIALHIINCLEKCPSFAVFVKRKGK